MHQEPEQITMFCSSAIKKSMRNMGDNLSFFICDSVFINSVQYPNHQTKICYFYAWDYIFLPSS